MQMLNLQKKIRNIKKSHLLIIGSFLVFIGIVCLTWNYFLRMKDEVYSAMNIAMSESTKDKDINTKVDDTKKEETTAPVADNLPATDNNSNNNAVVNYDKYLGVLQVPRVGLKRGFYNIGSRYNDIQYNVSMVEGSSLPDVNNGNLILMAHSGDAYISYFAYLYLLKIGDYANVTYNGVKYKYRLVTTYNVPKSGIVTINRNYNKTCLTLITCTKDDDYSQSIYIFELV